MKPFSNTEYRGALLRRRIKFVVEKGSMARMFRGGTNSALQQELYRVLRPEHFAQISSRDAHDQWLEETIELGCWEHYSRNGIAEDRWGVFAKLINIIVYEIASNRELLLEPDWERIRPFLHVPIDMNVTIHLKMVDPDLPAVYGLKGMSKKDYWQVQRAIRKLSEKHGVPPVWFEAAWSA